MAESQRAKALDPPHLRMKPTARRLNREPNLFERSIRTKKAMAESQRAKALLSRKGFYFCRMIHHVPKTLLVICVLLAAKLISAQTNIDTIITYPGFTIQGFRLNDSSLNVKQSYVISKEEIQNAPVQSINDLLNLSTGVDIRSRGALGVQSDVSIRGGSFDQSLVMIDGVKMSDIQTGHHLLNIPIDLNQIERVEQVNHGGSRWFGPYAFSGAINLITKRAKESKVNADIAGGEFGFFNAGASASVVTKNTSTSLSYRRMQSDGYIANTDFTQDNFSLISHIDIKGAELKLMAGQNDKKFGAQNFYSVFFPDQYEETSMQFVSAQAKLEKGKFSLRPRVYFRRHFDEFQLFREGPGYYEFNGTSLAKDRILIPGWYQNPNYHYSEILGTELNGSFESKLGTTNLGFERRQEFILSNNLGELRNLVEGNGDAYYNRSASRINNSIYFEQEGKWKKLGYSAGLLYNINTDFGNAVFPGIDLSYELTKSISAIVGANQNMRFPTYTDLYYNLGGAVGSIDLQPETSNSYQAGLRLKNKAVNAQAVLFFRETNNLIDWVRFNGSFITEATNLSAINFIGTEFDLNWNITQTAPDMFLERLQIKYSWIDADRESGDFESNYVLDFYKHKLYVGLDQSLGKKLKARWSIRYQDRLGGYFDLNEGGEVEFAPYALLDMRLYQNFKGVGWYAEIANLFNTQYREIGTIQMPGRWIRLGLSIELTAKQLKKKAKA